MYIEKMWIKVEGEGDGILLLHGWGVDHSFMEPIFDHYKSTHKIVLLDLPGFGESESLENKYTMNDYVLCIQEIITVYALKNISIIAHSFGARIAFAYASKFPLKVLILTGAAGIPSKKNFSYYFNVSLFKVLKKLNIKNQMGSEDYKNASSYMKDTLVSVLHHDSCKDIKSVPCPILLVWGEKDRQTPLWMAYKIKELNKNVSLLLFEEGNHFAYFHEMDRFLKICDFLLKGES